MLLLFRFLLDRCLVCPSLRHRLLPLLIYCRLNLLHKEWLFIGRVPVVGTQLRPEVIDILLGQPYDLILRLLISIVYFLPDQVAAIFLNL